MTDVLDRRIKGFVAELVDAAPVAPPLAPDASPAPHHSRRGLVALAAAVSCAVGAAALLVQVDNGQRSRVQLGGSPPVTPLVETYEKPTFVVPSRLPAGFQLVDAGSDTIRRLGTQEMVFWSEDFTRTGRIVWAGPDRRCPPAATPQWAGAAPQQEAIDAYRSGARTTAPPESLSWCDPADHTVVSLYARGLAREEIADLAEGVVRNGDDLSVSLPPGFTAVRTAEDQDLIRVLYRGPGGAELWVDIWGVGVLALERHRVDSENPASWEPVTLGGRPALKVDHFVSVLYDDHTLVDISGPLPATDLLAAAASLVPGDPSLPKPVASVPAICDRLGMCG